MCQLNQQQHNYKLYTLYYILLEPLHHFSNELVHNIMVVV
jgi:hypothetical protein